jgi:hypothetical protein
LGISVLLGICGFEQIAVVGQGALLDTREALAEFLSGSVAAQRFEGAGLGSGGEDALDGLGIEGVVAGGVFERPVDVVAVEALFEFEDQPGLKPCGPGVLEALEEALRAVAEGEEGFPHGLEPVAVLARGVVRRVFDGQPRPCRFPLVFGDEVEFGAVDEDFVFRGFQCQDVLVATMDEVEGREDFQNVLTMLG